MASGDHFKKREKKKHIVRIKSNNWNTAYW